ncbi:unnamed protein product [Cochlearia groenlandica]
MGCSYSKFNEDEEAIQICKDRKSFIKQAIEHRTNFASSHISYIHSLSQVSLALRQYIQVEEEETQELLSNNNFLDLSPSSYSKIITSNLVASGGNRTVLKVEDKPHKSPEIFNVESYQEADGFFGMNTPEDNSLGQGRDNVIPPFSPGNSQWDFFWNPFSSLDSYYGHNFGHNLSCVDDEIIRLKRVREEEGIPDLEEDESIEFEDRNIKETYDFSRDKVEVEVEVTDKDMNCIGTTRDDAKCESPGYTVYLNQRPTSMGEAIKELEDQFTVICTAAKEVSGLLEASKAQHTCTNELSAMKMLNPVALFSSRSSSSSRFLVSGSSESGFESKSEFSEESCMLSGSHQSTLDRLYAWEKKLYDEVKSGERVRIAYEKKCLMLKSHDVKGDDSSTVDKTRATIRDLHTQMSVFIHTIESISERIESLRDQELLPQLLELLQGLAQMWKEMAESHQIQKRTLDEAKLILARKHHKKRQGTSLHEIDSQRLASSASNLVSHLRNWRICFQEWITYQRSYLLSLTGWLLRCLRCDPDPEKVKLSTFPHPIYEVCIQWSRLINSLNEKPVLDKLDFFACGMDSIFSRELKEDTNGSRKCLRQENMELVEAENVEEDDGEKLAEIAVKVLCHGMSVAVSSMAEFAIESADEHSKLVSHSLDTKTE